MFGKLSMFEGYPEIKTCFDYLKSNKLELELLPQEKGECQRKANQKNKAQKVVKDYKEMYLLIKDLLGQEIQNL